MPVTILAALWNLDAYTARIVVLVFEDVGMLAIEGFDKEEKFARLHDLQYDVVRHGLNMAEADDVRCRRIYGEASPMLGRTYWNSSLITNLCGDSGITRAGCDALVRSIVDTSTTASMSGYLLDYVIEHILESNVRIEMAVNMTCDYRWLRHVTQEHGLRFAWRKYEAIVCAIENDSVGEGSSQILAIANALRHAPAMTRAYTGNDCYDKGLAHNLFMRLLDEEDEAREGSDPREEQVSALFEAKFAVRGLLQSVREHAQAPWLRALNAGRRPLGIQTIRNVDSVVIEEAAFLDACGDFLVVGKGDPPEICVMRSED